MTGKKYKQSILNETNKYYLKWCVITFSYVLQTYPLKAPGPVNFLFIITFITVPKTSYVGPDKSLVNLFSYFSAISSLQNH